MAEVEIKDAVTVDEAPEPARLPPPPPYVQPPAHLAPTAEWFDRASHWVERRPLLSAAAIFVLLTLVHVLLLNFAGVASGVFVGDEFFLASGSSAVEVVLFAFAAYNVALPTLVGRACLRAYDDLRPALTLDERGFAQARATLTDTFLFGRLCFGAFWTFILTPVFGDLFRAAIPGEGAGAALLMIWMYIRIALTFGLLGSSITFIAMLHHRFRGATGKHLTVDLFDGTALHPVARYARHLALLLILLLALAGPALAQPEAPYASASVLALGVLLIGAEVAGAMWGARRAIRAAKATALQELQTYSRELWRRAYAGGRIAEAVAIPALGAMLTVRAEIARLSDWPGGWSTFARLGQLAAIPILTWFGGELARQAVLWLTL